MCLYKFSHHLSQEQAFALTIYLNFVWIFVFKRSAPVFHFSNMSSLLWSAYFPRFNCFYECSSEESKTIINLYASFPLTIVLTFSNGQRAIKEPIPTPFISHVRRVNTTLDKTTFTLWTILSHQSKFVLTSFASSLFS